MARAGGRCGASGIATPPAGWSAGAAALDGVGFGGDAGGGLLAQVDVAAEAGQVLVAELGLQFGRGASGFGQMLERAVAKLVRGPALPMRVELG
nr:hypothetical protein [Nonomuraea aridisoli]